MSENREDYYNLVNRIEDAFSEIDSDISTDLFHTDTEYAALRREADQLQQAHPVIERILEGAGAISLSEKEHAAFVRYTGLKVQTEEAERRQIYFRGHTDSFAYLKKIGAI
ncbi:MAG TPA: hypothetical protein DEQ02_03835 [Ruminococcaceae bacterium]|nr:hypothetical protein [Oscillospiraceae bacterium]